MWICGYVCQQTYFTLLSTKGLSPQRDQPSPYDFNGVSWKRTGGRGEKG